MLRKFLVVALLLWGESLTCYPQSAAPRASSCRSSSATPNSPRGIGSCRETVDHVLGRRRDRGLITTMYRTIVIHDCQRSAASPGPAFPAATAS